MAVGVHAALWFKRFSTLVVVFIRKALGACNYCQSCGHSEWTLNSHRRWFSDNYMALIPVGDKKKHA